MRECYWEDHGSKPVQVKKKFARPHLNGKELGVMVHACRPSDGKKHKIGESRSRLAWAKMRPYL
jgi:hypothetical protein